MYQRFAVKLPGAVWPLNEALPLIKKRLLILLFALARSRLPIAPYVGKIG